MKTLIKNGTIVNSESSLQGDVLIEDGRITAIQPGLAATDVEIYDATGCRLFPGFVDAHTHLDMDAGACVTADNFQTGTRAAIAGGTTTIIDFATQDKGGTLKAALEAWQEKAQGVSACDYGFHMAITEWTPAVAKEIPDMAAAGVTSFKVYLAYDNLRVSDGEVF